LKNSFGDKFSNLVMRPEKELNI